MKYKPLGGHGPLISAIGLGTWGYGGFFSAETSRDDFFKDLVLKGVDLGLTFIDTAEAYGAGHCEEIIGRAVRRMRDKVFIASKVSAEHLAGPDVRKALEGSLKRLNTDYLDLYQVHWPNPRIPLEETFGALNGLVEAGLIRYIGVSNFSPKRLKEAISLSASGLVSIQSEYNLFDRGVEGELLPLCAEKSISFIASSPLDQGKALVIHQRSETLHGIAAKYDKKVSQVILNWLASHQRVIPIPRTMQDEHLESNAAALDFDLSEGEKEAISKAFVYEPILLPVDQIITDRKGLEGFVPGPAELAQDILAGDPLKPIRVAASRTAPGKYDLIEGKLRYWAWVQAHNGKAPVPALVR